MPSLLGALWPTWRMHHPKKWGGPLVIFWDALEISGSLWRRSGTLHDVPGRSTALWDSPGAFWRTLWGVLWTLWGWMGDADDGDDGVFRLSSSIYTNSRSTALAAGRC